MSMTKQVSAPFRGMDLHQQPCFEKARLLEFAFVAESACNFAVAISRLGSPLELD